MRLALRSAQDAGMTWAMPSSPAVIVWPLRTSFVPGSAEPLPDVVLDQGPVALLDEVPPVPRPEPDGRPWKARPRLQVEQPSHVIGVQVGADDVGDVLHPGLQGPQADGELATDQPGDVLVAARLGRPHPGVDQHAPVPAADEEAADREPCLAVAECRDVGDDAGIARAV